LNNLNAGTYEVSLTIKFGNCNATTTKAAFFTVLPGARAGFSANRTQFCKVPSTVEFYDSSTQAASLLWRFGNGQTSTLKNPQHTYTQFGKYNVTQVAIHSNGCRDSVIRPAYIRIDTAFLDIYADSNQ
ncbi:PKD domain-containing protein, partial [Umezakia ovalisporum]|uniref:PKD domain-containing protein n=1 Tax=Umezakia ovalisporum TaxID=75695 RepID=UPI0039C61E39